jgi:ATP-dependent DNA helicase PIF1
VSGVTSYDDLRTVDGLIEADDTLDECIAEATLYQMPSSLRRLFTTILVFYEPSDVRGL